MVEEALSRAGDASYGAAMIPSQRHLFEIPREVAYLNCAYMSPLSKAVTAASADGLARKARPWEIKSTHFFETPERARALPRVVAPDSEEHWTG